MDPDTRKKKKAKKIAVTVAVILLISGSAYFATLYTRKNKGTIRVGTLSERSKEFLKSQQEAPESELFGIQLNATPDTSGAQRHVAEGCFSLITGMKVSTVHRTEKCSISLYTEEPRTAVVAFLREGTYANLDDDSGVKMRRVYTDKYTEKTITANDQKYTIFKLKDEATYESTAFALVGGKLFALSVTSNTNENLDEKLMAIVKSVQFL